MHLGFAALVPANLTSNTRHFEQSLLKVITDLSKILLCFPSFVRPQYHILQRSTLKSIDKCVETVAKLLVVYQARFFYAVQAKNKLARCNCCSHLVDNNQTLQALHSHAVY